MTDVVVTCQDCVLFPTREDKPHRRLSLSLQIDAECPGIVVVTCLDMDRKVFEAEIAADTLALVAAVCEEMSKEIRRA